MQATKGVKYRNVRAKGVKKTYFRSVVELGNLAGVLKWLDKGHCQVCCGLVIRRSLCGVIAKT